MKNYVWFRAKYSTEIAVLEFSHGIIISISNSDETINVFLNSSNNVDMIDHNILQIITVTCKWLNVAIMQKLLTT